MRNHFLRELALRRDFIISHVESEEQHADFLTHRSPMKVFAMYHRDFLMNNRCIACDEGVLGDTYDASFGPEYVVNGRICIVFLDFSGVRMWNLMFWTLALDFGFFFRVDLK